MVSMHLKNRKEALHEPYDALLANEQVIHPGFMVPMHSKKRKGALHEPYDALLANEQVIHPGFMVPMHSKKRKGAFHEPRSSRRKEAHFSQSLLTSAATAPGRNACAKRKGSLHERAGKGPAG